VVDHLTRITLHASAERTEAAVTALGAAGFAIRRTADGIVAESSKVEAQEAKRWLRALGLQDREFQVFLEYVRRWGVL
jgi:hypothetical protein